MGQLGNWMLLVNIANFFRYQKKTTLSINQRLKSNGTDLRTLINTNQPCAGGLGEALVPQWGVWGEAPQTWFLQKMTIFRLSQCHSA